MRKTWKFRIDGEKWVYYDGKGIVTYMPCLWKGAAENSEKD